MSGAGAHTGKAGETVYALIDRLVGRIGVEETARKGPVVAYVAWAMVIVLGCVGWVTTEFCAFGCLVGLGAHLLAMRARTLLGTPL